MRPFLFSALLSLIFVPFLAYSYETHNNEVSRTLQDVVLTVKSPEAVKAAKQKEDPEQEAVEAAKQKEDPTQTDASYPENGWIIFVGISVAVGALVIGCTYGLVYWMKRRQAVRAKNTLDSKPALAGEGNENHDATEAEDFDFEERETIMENRQEDVESQEIDDNFKFCDECCG